MMPFPKSRRVVAADPLLEETTTIQVRKGEYEVVSGTYARAATEMPTEEPMELSVSDFQLEPEPPPPESSARRIAAMPAIPAAMPAIRATPIPAIPAMPPSPASPPNAGDDFARLLARELARTPVVAVQRALTRPVRIEPLVVVTPPPPPPAVEESDGYEVTAPRNVVVTKRQHRRFSRLSTAMIAMLVGILAVTAVAVEVAPARVARIAQTARDAASRVSASLR